MTAIRRVAMQAISTAACYSAVKQIKLNEQHRRQNEKNISTVKHKTKAQNWLQSQNGHARR
jgi:hypothetical protein